MNQSQFLDSSVANRKQTLNHVECTYFGC